jgi:hypothetical protein
MIKNKSFDEEIIEVVKSYLFEQVTPEFLVNIMNSVISLIIARILVRQSTNEN